MNRLLAQFLFLGLMACGGNDQKEKIVENPETLAELEKVKAERDRLEEEIKKKDSTAEEPNKNDGADSETSKADDKGEDNSTPTNGEEGKKSVENPDEDTPPDNSQVAKNFCTTPIKKIRSDKRAKNLVTDEDIENNVAQLLQGFDGTITSCKDFNTMLQVNDLSRFEPINVDLGDNDCTIPILGRQSAFAQDVYIASFKARYLSFIFDEENQIGSLKPVRYLHFEKVDLDQLDLRFDPFTWTFDGEHYAQTDCSNDRNVYFWEGSIDKVIIENSSLAHINFSQMIDFPDYATIEAIGNAQKSSPIEDEE
jgi:hypothetical protein